MSNLISTPSPFGSPAVEFYYGGQRLYPAPFIDYSKNINRNDVDIAISTEEVYTLNGVYLDLPSGAYSDVVTGMTNLKSIFSQDGLEIQIKAGASNTKLPSGTLIVSGIYPFIRSIGIPQGNQYHRFDYTVELVSKTSVSGVSGITSNSSDSWEFVEEPESASAKLTHRVSAVGINTSASGAASNALINAKNFVHSKLGSGNLPSGFPLFVVPGNVLDVPYRIYELNRSRSESFDTQNGSYDVTEEFIVTSGTTPYTHGRNADFSKDSDGIITVSIQGNVQGAGRTDGLNNPYNGFYFAQSGYNTSIKPNIASYASDVYSLYGGSGTLATNNPISYNISENRYLGTLTYSIEYSDDPAINTPSGIVEQSLEISRKDAVRVYASHAIPHRRLGNILQDIATTSEGSITITATAKALNTGDEVYDTNVAITHVQTLINSVRPNTADFITLRLDENGVSFENNRLERTASATVTWIFTLDLISVQAPDADIVIPPIT